MPFIKIYPDMTPAGSLAAQDLFEIVQYVSPGVYVTKSASGQNIVNLVSASVVTSLTAGSSNIVLTPSPITTTGTIDLNSSVTGIALNDSIIGATTAAPGTFTSLTLNGTAPTLNFDGTTSNTITTLAGVSGATGTAASPLTLTMGTSGNSSGSTAGANGANYTITGSTGGNSGTGNAGAGGGILMTAGNAGSSTTPGVVAAGVINLTGGVGVGVPSGSTLAGSGGLLTFQGGQGGAQLGTGIGGAGGGIALVGGAAGASTNANGGIGGSVSFTNGAAGNATSTNGNGGHSGNIRTFALQPGGNALGTGVGGSGGNLILGSAAGGNGSTIGTAGAGGSVTIQAGSTGSGAIAATPATFALIGGAVTTLTGGTTAGGNSGPMTLATAAGGLGFAGNGGNAGLISLTTGNGAASTGTNNNGGNSGVVSLLTGTGGASVDAGTGGNAANITVTAGNGGTSLSGAGGNGGNLILTAGNGGVGGDSNGLSGNIQLVNAGGTWKWATNDSPNFLKSDGAGNLSFAPIPTGLYNPDYLYGLTINNTSSSATQFSVSAGNCIDSTDTRNINISFGANLDMSISGVYGLDTGSFAPNEIYCVYAIGDSTNVNPDAAVASLNQTHPTVTGYNKYRFIGAVFSNSSTQLYKMVTTGNGVSKDVRVDFAVESVILSSGTSSGQTGIGTLSSILPNNGSIQKVKFSASFQAATVTDYAFVTTHGFSIANNGAPITIGAGVLTQVDEPFELEPSPSFEIDYLVTHTGAGNSALTLLITGYVLGL
jgi:hypothetical protein